uniref:Uncharacterized protein n=1 Tax=Oryza sativa subsp. japonica TaxID=39947 RepID=Q6YW26_ORYSJ|nr:hypothetical protein [Oryza sativa Japonica Group]BAD05840.1 hypothetical protein [Oryza sativa Japonica Group]
MFQKDTCRALAKRERRRAGRACVRALEPAFVSALDENVNACDPVDFRVAAFSQHDGGERR